MLGTPSAPLAKPMIWVRAEGYARDHGAELSAPFLGKRQPKLMLGHTVDFKRRGINARLTEILRSLCRNMF